MFDFVCIDVETTGLSPEKDEIIEVTAIEYDLNGKIGITISEMCRPISGFIPAEASAINKITYDMVKDKKNYLSEGIREKIAEFIGTRTVSGHNIIGFDSKFLKIHLDDMADTLLMCRKKYSGGNKLKTACLRENIEWDDREAHRAGYDCLKTIELHCKLNQADEVKKAKEDQLSIFHVESLVAQEEKIIKEIVDISIDPSLMFGIVPTDREKNLVATQTYSYSRLNLFNQCPFKWYMQYIKGYKEPDKSYFQTGKICHKVAEWSGEWCYRKTFTNKLKVYLDSISYNYGDNQPETFCEYIYDNQEMITKFFPEEKNIAYLIKKIDDSIDMSSYELASMPDLETYNNMIEKAINNHKCSDPEVINEVKSIMARFYRLKDFSTMPGEVMLMERKLVFDKQWNPLKDFYSREAFFRGIIDVIAYMGNSIIITDYKSSRKMMTIKELMEDRQTMTYAYLISKYLPKGSYNKIIVRVDYIRYGEVVEYEINDVDDVAKRALDWINSTISCIESEILKTDAFPPIRNEYCHSCFLGEDGLCPLFNKMISGRLDDPFSCSVVTVKECRAAWKRIETNKAENERLSKLCKAFVKQCDDPIIIDEKAKLDFYLSKYRDFDSSKTIIMLLKKGIRIEDIVKHVNVPNSSMVEFLEEKKIVLTQEELDSISKEKSRYSFDAYTVDEVSAKGFINA